MRSNREGYLPSLCDKALLKGITRGDYHTATAHWITVMVWRDTMDAVHLVYHSSINTELFQHVNFTNDYL